MRTFVTATLLGGALGALLWMLEAWARAWGVL
jgi:hypothetical protein